MIPHKETIFSRVKRGIYTTRRYPWGSGARGADGKPLNGYAINVAHTNFYTTANQSKEALPRNEQRRFCQIQNMSVVNDITFGWGTNPSIQDGITLTPGQVEIFDVACPVEQLYIFSAGGAQRVALVEGF